MACIRVGLSGWSYSEWRGDFYPEGLPARERLRYAATRFPTLEINASFYSLKQPRTYAAWHAEAPEVTFAVKGSKLVTHNHRLANAEQALANFYASGVLALGAGLGPFLWQLPPSLRFDAERVEAFLSGLPRSTTELAERARRHDDRVPAKRALTEPHAEAPVRHALEPRHTSWADPAAADLLAAYDVAMVVSDLADRYPMFEVATTDFVYVRLHGHTRLYYSGYAAASLDAWADRCRRWAGEERDVFVYFDNSAAGKAPHDALKLMARLADPSG